MAFTHTVYGTHAPTISRKSLQLCTTPTSHCYIVSYAHWLVAYIKGVEPTGEGTNKQSTTTSGLAQSTHTSFQHAAREDVSRTKDASCQSQFKTPYIVAVPPTVRASKVELLSK